MTTQPNALVFSHGKDAVAAAVVRVLREDGWRVGVGGVDGATGRCSDPADGPIDGVVYVPALFDGATEPEPATVLLNLVDTLRPHLRTAADGGARVAAVSSRDWLGWPSRPRVAGQAAALIAAVRSLALAHGRAGITVNAVVGMPPEVTDRRPVPGTHLLEPVPLQPEPIGPDDIAGAVAFFLDRRSDYLTGQVLHCCGGASLLSSLSV